MFSGRESEVLVVGDSLVKYLGTSVSGLEFVSLPGKGVEAVSQWVGRHVAPRHKLVIVHVGTNDLAGGVPVHTLYNKLCSLNANLPTGVQLCISGVLRRWESRLPGCWYSLSHAQLVSFNRRVDELNCLLSGSGISVLGHHQRFGCDRRLFARDGLHLSRSGSYYLAQEIENHTERWMVSYFALLQFLALDCIHSVLAVC